MHDLRVSTRRLLAQLDGRSTAAGRRERRRLRRLLRATTRARDSQVQARLLRRLTPGDQPPGLEKFRQRLHRRARQAARKLARTLAARPRRLRPGRAAPVPPATAALVRSGLRSAFARLRRRLRRACASGDPDALHRARKTVKQCRYLAEAAGAGGTQLARLRALQAALGELHDLDLLLDRMESHATRHRRTAVWLRRHGGVLRRRRMRHWRNLPRSPGPIPTAAAAGPRKGTR